MPIQTTYERDPRPGLAGQLADTTPVRDVLSFTVEDADGIKPGRGVVRGSDDGLVQNPPAVPAADVDAFIETFNSAAAPQTLDDADLDGEIGGAEMAYGRRVRLVLSNNAHWTAGSATLTGVDAITGDIVEETLAIPSGGNATVTSERFYSRVISLDLPAGGGASGTATLGTAAGDVVLNAGAFRGLSRLETAREVEIFADEETLGVLRLGRMYVAPETAVRDGDRVYMRVVAGVGEERGALRADPDGGDAVPLPARFRRTTAAPGEISIVQLF